MVFVVRELFAYLKAKRSDGLTEVLAELLQKSRDLHKSHLGAGAIDSKGWLRWWNKDEVNEAVLETAAATKKMAEESGEQTKLLTEMLEQLKRLD